MKMAATPAKGELGKISRRKKMTVNTGRRGRTASPTQWQKINESTWVTVQQLMTTKPDAEIARQTDGSHILSITGHRQHVSAHSSPDRAKEYYEKVTAGR